VQIPLFPEQVTGPGFSIPVPAIKPLFHSLLAAEFLRQRHFRSRDPEHPVEAPVAFVRIDHADGTAVYREMACKKGRQRAFAASSPSAKQESAHYTQSPLRLKNPKKETTGNLWNFTTDAETSPGLGV
jgi:hypothetical protein